MANGGKLELGERDTPRFAALVCLSDERVSGSARRNWSGFEQGLLRNMANGRTTRGGSREALRASMRCLVSVALCIVCASCADTYSTSRVVRRPTPSTAVTTSPGSKSAQTTAVASRASASDYRIQPLDTLQITVFNEPDLSVKARVSSQGAINYPMLGAVQIGGLTISEAENLLKERLGRDYLVNPQVSMFVDRATNRRVFILGQVRSPGAIDFSADEKLTVLQAIARAGGFTPVAAPGRVSISRSSPDGTVVHITVNVNAIIQSGDRSKDVELQPDDVISVPESVF